MKMTIKHANPNRAEYARKRKERTNEWRAGQEEEGRKNRFVRSDVNMEGNKKKHTEGRKEEGGRMGRPSCFLLLRVKRETVSRWGGRVEEGRGYVVLNPLVVMATDK